MNRDRLLLVGFPERTHKLLLDTLRERFELIHFEGDPAPDEAVLSPQRFQWNCFLGARELWRRICRFSQDLHSTTWEKIHLLLKLLNQLRRVSLARLAARNLLHRGGIRAVLTITDSIGPYRAMIEEANSAGLPTLLVYHGASCNVPTASRNEHLRELWRPRAKITCVESPPEIDYVKEVFGLEDRAVVAVGPLTNQRCDSRPPQSKAGIEKICYISGYPASWCVSSAVLDDLHEHRCFESLCRAWVSFEPRPPGNTRELVFRSHPALRGLKEVSQWGHFQKIAALHGIRLTHDDSPGLDATLESDLIVSSYPSSVAFAATLAGIPNLCIVSDWMRSLTRTTDGHKVSWLMEKGLCLGVGFDELSSSMARLLDEGRSGRYRERVRATLSKSHHDTPTPHKSLTDILQEVCRN